MTKFTLDQLLEMLEEVYARIDSDKQEELKERLARFVFGEIGIALPDKDREDMIVYMRRIVSR